MLDKLGWELTVTSSVAILQHMSVHVAQVGFRRFFVLFYILSLFSSQEVSFFPCSSCSCSLFSHMFDGQNFMFVMNELRVRVLQASLNTVSVHFFVFSVWACVTTTLTQFLIPLHPNLLHV